ncbi:MAG: hypothetical protein IT585_08700 [candidate division Zixibacteria bacterium]|nr:hypothetical protein [candidate division Zixibacteria bacterium]
MGTSLLQRRISPPPADGESNFTRAILSNSGIRYILVPFICSFMIMLYVGFRDAASGGIILCTLLEISALLLLAAMFLPPPMRKPSLRALCLVVGLTFVWYVVAAPSVLSVFGIVLVGLPSLSYAIKGSTKYLPTRRTAPGTTDQDPLSS